MAETEGSISSAVGRLQHNSPVGTYFFPSLLYLYSWLNFYSSLQELIAHHSHNFMSQKDGDFQLRVDTKNQDKPKASNLEEGYVPSKYSKAFNNYARNELRSVTPILKVLARNCHIGFKYPVYKVLKAVAKIFLLNEVEAIFFAYMIWETKWDIRDKLILLNSEHVRDVVALANEQPQYKSLILYLMLVTYSLKFYLNESSAELLEQANRICPNFMTIFQNWVKKHSHLTKRINPKTLNRVYMELYSKVRHEDPDYSLLVDAILQISPAYNPEKSDKDKRLEKNIDRKEHKRDLQGPPLRKASFFTAKTQSAVPKTEASGQNISDHNPVFSSSRINQMAGIGECSGSFIPYAAQQKNTPTNRFGGGAFCSSILGMPDVPLKVEEDDCEELNIGLQDGQSEQNIVFEQHVEQDAPPVTSVINLSQGTQKYLSWKNPSE